ncbi:MAG: hypothetical protein A2W03_06110 [Candidatus Aminicenantes bacterium RBG_16_63_16]|nr:MAG: hypothetical protein A2W03_06110 [Candidatus Aminicenantes bacterium RBG_16_63_16]
MNFAKKPDNDFRLFITTYFDRCRAECPKLEAVAGKWTFEDLIPGLSDFDTRFIFADGVGVEDWARMSSAVGRVHTALAKEAPRWARILEHLPGLNLTLAEMLDPRTYYPEARQWTYYLGDRKALGAIEDGLARKPWTPRDESFHLRKFATYFGPYLRGIDPPINIGPWENKYPLHSRFMHYFTPPVQSALSIVRQKGMRGKLAALRGAKEVFPHPEVIDLVLEAVDRHYEIPEYYAEPRLTEIERMLEKYLNDAYACLAGQVSLIEIDLADTPAKLKEKISAVAVDPRERFFEGAKFSRFMKGRLLFYAEEILWFEAAWLIRNELGRIVNNFYTLPLETFALARFGEKIPPETALERLRGDILPPDVCEGARKFVRTAQAPCEPGEEKAVARRVAEVFDPVLVMLETLGAELNRSNPAGP